MRYPSGPQGTAVCARPLEEVLPDVHHVAPKALGEYKCKPMSAYKLFGPPLRTIPLTP